MCCNEEEKEERGCIYCRMKLDFERQWFRWMKVQRKERRCEGLKIRQSWYAERPTIN